MKIIYYIYIAYIKVLLFFKITKSSEPIPRDTPYCYKFNDSSIDIKNGYRITPCKYYKMLGEVNACTYVGYIGDDIVFGDQCKICDIE